MPEYVNNGTLFSNSVKKSEKSPDYSGDITLDLSALGIGTGTHKIQLAGWKKISSKTNKSFLSLRASMRDKPEDNKQTEEEPF